MIQIPHAPQTYMLDETACTRMFSSYSPTQSKHLVLRISVNSRTRSIFIGSFMHVMQFNMVSVRSTIILCVIFPVVYFTHHYRVSIFVTQNITVIVVSHGRTPEMWSETMAMCFTGRESLQVLEDPKTILSSTSGNMTSVILTLVTKKHNCTKHRNTDQCMAHCNMLCQQMYLL